MATTEAGGGVPGGEGLRERIAKALYENEAYDHWHCEVPDSELVDAVFSEIAAAGFELVPVERMDRLVKLARMYGDMRVVGPLGDVGSVADLLLQPGDLDRPEGRE
jgi:hypothetical protein